ncbi:hypothetical protein PENANT_c002G05449 [Penicillium antarcticum]|uniref:UBR-type domain-containing protein n=1 Tax=Penicillium antarcticum TaxID=416450 RepID=A0A1V6QJN1_9EURO|nr:uncharacterized protein N7508_008456 [Penicillium antarcticum]KAJ5293635.1 hypothetical protein N7508_008456 [Penicillium antarcticum]OQD89411.1 hypothetical protein PENANT_c002G05449 [Penicillium antarcticum]
MDSLPTVSDQVKAADGRRDSFSSQTSQTARQFIDSQLQLEADAREALPYSFDSCTYALGPLRQILFACLTCNPTPTNPDEPYDAAAVCYSCSISCHGEHELVELFNKRNFVCDCGTTRMPSSSTCTLREDPKTGKKGVHSQEAAAGNSYNHNFRNQFCGCSEQYDAHKEKGIMFQCLGIGTVETGGCGEDWWHPECLIGVPRDWNKAEPKINVDGDATNDAHAEYEEAPLPPGFPLEDDFHHLICFKCIDSNPWIKPYAGTRGFLPPVFKEGGLKNTQAAANNSAPKIEAQVIEPKAPEQTNSKKRKADDKGHPEDDQSIKRTKEESVPAEDQQPGLASIKEEPVKKEEDTTPLVPSAPKHTTLPDTTPTESFSLFALEDFHDQLCRCAECFPRLAPHPQLREEEDTYEPPLSEDGDANGAASTGTGSILERGEAAFNNIDRVRAIEGAMAYNHLRDNLKEFLRPFAESGQAVSADDIKSHFEKLRGDDQGIKDAAGHASAVGGGDEEGTDGDGRREQNGY